MSRPGAASASGAGSSSRSAAEASVAGPSGSGSGSSSRANGSQLLPASDPGHGSAVYPSKHHPYRIEVQDVNPVSVTLLISLRPPPISQLHRRESRGKKPSATTREDEEEVDWDDAATAVDDHAPVPSSSRPSPNEEEEDSGMDRSRRSPEEAARLERFRRQKERQHQVFLRHMALAKAEGKISSFGNGTISFNGQAAADSQRGQGASASGSSSANGRAARQSRQQAEADDDAQNDSDEALAPPSALVLASAATSPSETSESPVARLFAEGVSVLVDGSSWKHVLMSDSHSQPGEAIIVIFGLRPGFQHKIELCIGPEAVCYAVGRAKGRRKLQEEKRRQLGEKPERALGASAAHLGDQDAEESFEMTPRGLRAEALAVPEHPSPRIISPVRSRRSSFNLDHAVAASADDSMQGEPSSTPVALRLAALQAELAAAQETRNQLSADVRKARKEASRTEAALRNEIDAVKRGLERMSGTDNRSKQKVLALQESIRQANVQAEEAECEAQEVERGLDEWRVQEEQRESDLKQHRDVAEQKERELAAVTREAQEAISGRQKALDLVSRKADESKSEAQKLELEEIAGLLAELEQLKAETEELEHAPVDVDVSEILQQDPAYRPTYGAVGKQGRQPGGRAGGTRAGQSGKGRKQQHASATAAEFVPASIRSVSQPIGSAPATNGTFSAGSTGSFPLNPNNPEFVPSSVLLAQAHREQQGRSTPPLAHPQGPPPGLGSAGPYGGEYPFFPPAAAAAPFRPHALMPSAGGPPPPPPLPISVGDPMASLSAFSPFSPIDPSPPNSDTQHESPARAQGSPMPPFSADAGIGSGGWPSSSSSGFASGALSSVQPGAPRALSNSSPWNSPRLGARRVSGLGGSGPSLVTSSPALGPLSSGNGVAPGMEKDIWANPAGNRSGTNIWGPLSGLSSAAVGAGVRDRDPGGNGSVGSGGGSGSIHGHHTLHHQASNSGGLHSLHSMQHASSSPLLAYTPGIASSFGGHRSSSPESPSSSSFGANTVGYSWDRSSGSAHGKLPSDHSGSSMLSPIQPPSASAIGARSPISSPLAAHAPTLASFSAGAAADDREDGQQGSQQAQRSFASVAATH